MNSIRFNPPKDWKPNELKKIQGDGNGGKYNSCINRYWRGLNVLAQIVGEEFTIDKVFNPKMIEIGSYMGESTLVFGSMINWEEINCIDPLEGEEIMNDISKLNWTQVGVNFLHNTQYFNVKHFRDYSYNVADKFKEGEYDFLYIDANHEYESVKKDLELYVPKIKTFGIIGGHDYTDSWPGVKKAVNEIVINPKDLKLFEDGSWLIKRVNTTI